MLWGWNHILLPYPSSFFLLCSAYNMKEVIELMSGQLRGKEGKLYRGCQAATWRLAFSLTDEDGCTAWPLCNNWFYNIPLLKTRKDRLSLERNTFSEFLMNCSQAQTHFGLGKKISLDSLQQNWQRFPLKSCWNKRSHFG